MIPIFKSLTALHRVQHLGQFGDARLDGSSGNGLIAEANVIPGRLFGKKEDVARLNQHAFECSFLGQIRRFDVVRKANPA